MSMGDRMKREPLLRYWLTLTVTHFFVDLVVGMLPPVMPQLMERFDTKLLGSTTLIAIFAIGANVGQPVFGRVSDWSAITKGEDIGGSSDAVTG